MSSLNTAAAFALLNGGALFWWRSIRAALLCVPFAVLPSLFFAHLSAPAVAAAPRAGPPLYPTLPCALIIGVWYAVSTLLKAAAGGWAAPRHGRPGGPAAVLLDALSLPQGAHAAAQLAAAGAAWALLRYFCGLDAMGRSGAAAAPLLAATLAGGVGGPVAAQLRGAPEAWGEPRPGGAWCGWGRPAPAPAAEVAASRSWPTMSQ